MTTRLYNDSPFFFCPSITKNKTLFPFVIKTLCEVEGMSADRTVLKEALGSGQCDALKSAWARIQIGRAHV